MSWEALRPEVKARVCKQINADYPWIKASTTRRTKLTGRARALRIENTVTGTVIYYYGHDNSEIREALKRAMRGAV